MKIEVTIEETVSQQFIIDVPNDQEPYDYIANQYNQGNLILTPGEIQFKQMEIHNLEDNTWTEWKEF